MSKKYIEVFNILRVNELEEKGYRLHTKLPRLYVDDASGRIMTDYVYTMSLQEPSKYDDMVAFKKMPITYEEQPIPVGWKAIHHTAKEIVLKKTGEASLVQELKDWLDKDGELDSVISIVEDYCYAT